MASFGPIVTPFATTVAAALVIINLYVGLFTYFERQAALREDMLSSRGLSCEPYP